MLKKNNDTTASVWINLGIIFIVMIIIFSRQITNSALGLPDADRILMDGVFIHDFLLDMPLTHIYDYTINYFGQYPALSIGYRPPFFPFVEGLFHFVFGVNMVSSRLALLLFAFIGFTSWFFLIRRIFDIRTAFFSSLLLVTMPFMAKWGWYFMAELPLISMTMLVSYLFYRYTETNSVKFLFLTTIAFIVAVWTKQTAFYLAFWFVLYLFYEGTLLERLKEKKTWLSIVFILICLIPLALITIWLGKQNMAQSVGASNAATSIWMQKLNAIPLHYRNIVDYQLSLPALILTLLGMITALVTKEKKAVFFALFIFVTFVFFSYIIHKNERYTIFWIPSFTLFAVLPIYFLRKKALYRNLFAVFLSGVILYQVNEIYAKEPMYATGYDKAAAYVLKHSHSSTVFVDAYNNGYFTYFMRSLDPEKSMYVLRADKLLASSSIDATNMLKVHAHNREDIKKIIEQFGIELIVVESRDLTTIKIYQEFRDYLVDGPFELLKRIPVKSSRPALINQDLLIYKYKNYKPSEGGFLELHLPVVGQTIKVPIRGSSK